MEVVAMKVDTVMGDRAIMAAMIMRGAHGVVMVVEVGGEVDPEAILVVGVVVCMIGMRMLVGTAMEVARNGGKEDVIVMIRTFESRSG